MVTTTGLFRGLTSSRSKYKPSAVVSGALSAATQQKKQQLAVFTKSVNAALVIQRHFG
jgi:hypothetical protein